MEFINNLQMILPGKEKIHPCPCSCTIEGRDWNCSCCCSLCPCITIERTIYPNISEMR